MSADVWCYPWGESVLGGRDLTVRDALGQTGRAPADEVSATSLAWACALQEVVAPVVPADGDLLGLVVGLDAPELAPERLLGLGDLAGLLGASRAEVDGWVVRGRLPTHQLVLAGSRRWSRPVVERWMEGRA